MLHYDAGKFKLASPIPRSRWRRDRDVNTTSTDLSSARSYRSSVGCRAALVFQPIDLTICNV